MYPCGSLHLYSKPSFHAKSKRCWFIHIPAYWMLPMSGWQPLNSEEERTANPREHLEEISGIRAQYSMFTPAIKESKSPRPNRPMHYSRHTSSAFLNFEKWSYDSANRGRLILSPAPLGIGGKTSIFRQLLIDLGRVF